MAEVIGAIASIAGLADVSAKIAIGLFKLAQAIGSAGRDIRSIAHSTKLVSGVLSNLSTFTSVQKRSSTTMRGRILVEDAIELCREILDDCEAVIKIFQPLISNTGKRRERALLRIRMLFERSRLMTHRDALDKLTGVLTLHLTVMSYSQISREDANEEICDSVRVQVECSIATVKDSCRDRIKVTRLLEFHTTHIKGFLLGPSDTSSEIQNTHSQSLIEFDDIQSLASDQSPAVKIAQDILSKELEEVESLYGGRSVTGDNPTSEYNKSKDSDVASTVDLEDIECDLEKDLDLELEAKFALADFDDLLEPYMQLKSLQKKTVQFAEQILEVNSVVDGTPSESDRFTDALDRRGDEDEESVVGSDSHREVLRLRDVRGQTFCLPFEEAKTWDEITDLLLEIYDNDPKYIAHASNEPSRESVRRRSRSPISRQSQEEVPKLQPFQLFGPDGHPILPRVWSLVIEPGDLITMRFRDERLNGPGSHAITATERAMSWLRSWWDGRDTKPSEKKIQDPTNRAKLARGRDSIIGWIRSSSSSSLYGD